MEYIRKRMEGTSATDSFSLPTIASSIHSLETQRKPYGATRYDYQGWFHDFYAHRPIFLTGVFNDYVGFGRGDANIERIQKNHRHFFNDLHRQIYKKSKRKLPRLVVIEQGAGRFHSHMVLETPEHLSRDQFHKMLTDSWKKTKYGVNLHIAVGYDKNGLDEYCSKELGNENTNYSQVDFKNCWKLQKS